MIRRYGYIYIVALYEFFFSIHRYPINHNHMDDFLTQPWFIALLGSILAIMMLSFGAMVFVKRKHMLMKQSSLGTIRGKFISRIPI